MFDSKKYYQEHRDELIEYARRNWHGKTREERDAYNETNRWKYKNNEKYREYKKQQARAYYYKRKNQKKQNGTNDSKEVA